MADVCSTAANNTKWHYTTGNRLRAIFTDGVIKPATAFVPMSERPVVWFSTNEEWEPTANKLGRDQNGSPAPLDRDGTAELYGGLARIAVADETAPFDWDALKRRSGMSNLTARGLRRAAISSGSRPGDWWGTFDPVPRDQWVAIEVWHEGRWVNVPLDAAVSA
jgi:hypothetical protein